MIMSKHGSLESAILSALWDLENNGRTKNSVHDVYDALNSSSENKKAYTTIKTVMDRLHDKKVLNRTKQGNKFYYRTLHSSSEVIRKALNELAERYCNGDIKTLINFVEKMNKESQLIGA